MKDGCHICCKVVEILLLIGALNLGLIGLSDHNLIAETFNKGVERLVYLLIGAAAVLKIIWMVKSCSSCKK